MISAGRNEGAKGRVVADRGIKAETRHPRRGLERKKVFRKTRDLGPQKSGELRDGEGVWRIPRIVRGFWVRETEGK